MSKTVAVVAYHYPPESVIGAARPARFTKYLPQFGWDAQVVTAAEPTRSMQGVLVHSIPDHTRSLWDSGSHDPRSSPMEIFAEKVARRFLFPGTIALSWSLRAPDIAESSIRTSHVHPSLVFSTYPPLACFSVGAALSRRFHIPWVVDLRDPYVFSPQTVNGFAPRWMQRHLERRYLSQAAAIVVNTESSEKMYKLRYPQLAHKVLAIPNGFDPEDLLGPLPTPVGENRTLRHVGELYAGRSPHAILASVARLRDRGIALVNDLEVGLIGPCHVDEADSRFMASAAADGWLDLREHTVPKDEALRLIQESHGLLLLQNQSAVQIPGKLYEYIRIGRPILALSPRGSAVEWMLSQCGIPYVNIYPDDSSDAVDQKLLQFLEFPSTPVAASAWFQNRFNAKAQTQQLAELFDRVLAESKKRSS